MRVSTLNALVICAPLLAVQTVSLALQADKPVALTDEKKGEPEETIKVTLASILGIPDGFMANIAEQLPEGMPLPWEITLSDGKGKPAKGLKLDVMWEGGKRQLQADSAGLLQFSLSRDELIGARLMLPKGFTAESVSDAISVSVSTDDGTGSDVSDAPDLLEGLAGLETGNLAVRFPEGMQPIALEALAELARIRGFVAGYSGMSLDQLGFGIAVVDTMASEMRLDGQLMLPITMANWKDAKGEGGIFRWALVHEWVELNLVLGGGIYFHDPSFRMAGDGLAELHSLAYCSRFHPSAAAARLENGIKSVQRMKAAGMTTYDLAAEFRYEEAMATSSGDDGPEVTSTPPTPPGADLEAEGYAVALWFWKTTLEKAGADKFQGIQAWLMKARGITLADVASRIKDESGADLSLTPDLGRVEADMARWLKELRAQNQ